MNWRKIGAALCFCSLLIGACGGDESAIKKVILETLKDPDSAQFGKITIINTGRKSEGGKDILGACATVNAKTPMGGYGGKKQVILVGAGGSWERASDHGLEVSHEVCLETIKGLH